MECVLGFALLRQPCFSPSDPQITYSRVGPIGNIPKSKSLSEELAFFDHGNHLQNLCPWGSLYTLLHCEHSHLLGMSGWHIWNWRVRACVCVFVCIIAHVCVCICVYDGQRAASGSLTLFFKTVSHWPGTCQVARQPESPQGSICFCLLNPGITSMSHHTQLF